VRVGATTLAVFAAVVAGIGIAWLDVAVLGELPASIWLALPVTLGIAVLVAVVAGRAVKLGHVRSPAVAAAIGVFLALVTDVAALHFTQARYPAALHAALTRQDETLRRVDGQVRGFHTVDGKTVLEDLPVRPPVPSLASLEAELPLPQFVRERLDVGWSLRSLDGTLARGSVVIGIWLAELAVLALAAAFGAMASARDPYCEACGRFARARTTRLVNDVDFRAVRAAADGGRLAGVLELPRDAKAGKSVLFDALACPVCGDGAYVSASILPAGARGARPGAVKEFLDRMTHPFGRRRAGGTSSRVDTHLFERALFTSAQRDALFPSERPRSNARAP